MSDPGITPPDCYRQIARAIAENAPDGWASGRMTFRRVGGVADNDTVYELADGSSVRRTVRDSTVLRAFDALRAIFYQEGKGTWFSAEFTLRRVGHFSTDFDYDNEPAWPFDVDARAYVQDLDRFPRDPGHIPEWLQAKVDAAGGKRGGRWRWRR